MDEAARDRLAATIESLLALYEQTKEDGRLRPWMNCLMRRIQRSRMRASPITLGFSRCRQTTFVPENSPWKCSQV